MSMPYLPWGLCLFTSRVALGQPKCQQETRGGGGKSIYFQDRMSFWLLFLPCDLYKWSDLSLSLVAVCFVLFLNCCYLLKIDAQLGTHEASTAARSAEYQTYILAGIIPYLSSAAWYLRDFLCILLFTRHHTCDGAEQDNSYLLPLQGSLEGNISKPLHLAECEADVPSLPATQLYSSKRVTHPPRHDSASQAMQTNAA